MKLYEFALEVQDGVNEYLLHEFGAASTDRLAARFAHRWALGFRPGARFNRKASLFEAPEGYPTWHVSSIREVIELAVQCADNGEVVRFEVQERTRRSHKRPTGPSKP